MIHQLGRLIGFILIRAGWRIYPECDDREMLTGCLTVWTEFITERGQQCRND